MALTPMRGRTLGVVTVCSLALLAVGIALAEQQAGVLAKKLAEFRGADRGQVSPVTDESVARAVPGHLFYVLRFRQYPVAVVAPEPLRANNLFVVKPSGLVDHLPDAKALEGFFRSALAPVQTEAQAADAAKAWLRLAQEFRQDGFFRFSIPDDSVHAASVLEGGLQVVAKAVVDPQGGNAGEIVASLTFDRGGKLATVLETDRVRRGIRPICQATKLLDPDPVVRGMAEQALLVMGRAAQGYLAEQRAKASPELRRAIDQIWQRILTEDR